ncbi:HI0074 family nucleotidyltransferase substrate-binding subunit [Sulfuriferula sp.]|uniref:HI0074 family nucleotidyltransferase substrate-binding subunit n=1 Tax=Sulfuriferula sp. TaxID=2025307 RepID=UPI0027300D1E|nr:HI0074 family nucleotidyltransferase substrate-binding subunit [Sulfuriferula sp.]MDP2025567.1 HI0074 family nucleotidyltransferase substrate-binding subunit [Sulfuriferula sp.]
MADSQWIVDDFSVALTQLQNALDVPAELDLIKAGCIQYFEFSFELGWKACKVVSAEQGLPDCLSPKACLRQAFTSGWIEDEVIWLEMLDARNRMSHTYDARKALEIYKSLPQFHAALQKLLATLQSLIQS